jgi:hypothetical protein
VSREAKDILLKYIADALRGDFPAALGLDLPPIVEPLPAELPTLEVRAEQPDRFYRLADRSILHLEFQTTVDEEDLPRFYHSQFAAGEHYRTKVHSVVIYGAGITSAVDTLDRGSAVYRVRQVFLGTQDAEAVVTLLRERVSAGTSLTVEERVRVMLLPLMRQQRPLLEVLREVAGLARSLPQAERDETIGAMVGLAYNYLEPAMALQLLEVLRMANALEKLIEDTLVRGREEGREEGRAEGREEGELEGFRKAVRHAIELRFGRVPPVLEARLATSDEPTLMRIFDRLATASGPDDLLVP